jgi:hypothetical protein
MERARELIVQHPLLVTGGALAIGAILGFGRPRGRIAGAISGAIGAMAIGLVRELAMKKVSAYARHWIDQSEPEHPQFAGH